MEGVGSRPGDQHRARRCFQDLTCSATQEGATYARPTVATYQNQIYLLHNRLLQYLLFDLFADRRVAPRNDASLRSVVDDPLQDQLGLFYKDVVESIPTPVLDLVVRDHGCRSGRIQHGNEDQVRLELGSKLNGVVRVRSRLLHQLHRYENLLDHAAHHSAQLIAPVGAI